MRAIIKNEVTCFLDHGVRILCTILCLCLNNTRRVLVVFYEYLYSNVVITEADKVLIKNSDLLNIYGSRKLLSGIPEKNLTKRGLLYFFH